MQPDNRFREATRIQQSFLAALEKKTLYWLAPRTPLWINSDHLTVLGLLAMAGAGAGYWWARTNPLGLGLVVLCLAVNWLGDSLDGTLAPEFSFFWTIALSSSASVIANPAVPVPKNASAFMARCGIWRAKS